MALTVDKGSVCGRDHIVYGLNCQDSLVAQTLNLDGFTYMFGFVADGCGEFRRNETGAHLTTSFLTLRTIALLKKGISVLEIPEVLYEDLLSFLARIVDCYVTDVASLALAKAVAKEHLQATALGYIIGPEDVVVFAAGDGVVVLNDVIDIRDQNNQPNYPMYHALRDEFFTGLRLQLPRGFSVYVEKTENLKRLAIGTDAWKNEIATLLEFLGEHRPTNMQRAMNVLSTKHKCFKDDASLIHVFSVLEEGGSNESATG